MSDTSTTDETDETAERDTVKLTLEFEIDLSDDDVHRPAWKTVLAAAPDRETALGTLASRCEFSVGPRAAIYQQHRIIEQQQQQVAQGMMGARQSNHDIDMEGEQTVDEALLEAAEESGDLEGDGNGE